MRLYTLSKLKCYFFYTYFIVEHNFVKVNESPLKFIIKAYYRYLKCTQNKAVTRRFLLLMSFVINWSSYFMYEHIIALVQKRYISFTFQVYLYCFCYCFWLFFGGCITKCGFFWHMYAYLNFPQEFFFRTNVNPLPRMHKRNIAINCNGVNHKA